MNQEEKEEMITILKADGTQKLTEPDPLVEAIIDVRCLQIYLDTYGTTEATRKFLEKLNKKS